MRLRTRASVLTVLMGRGVIALCAMIAFGVPTQSIADASALPSCQDLFVGVPAGPLSDAANFEDIQRGCHISWIENGALRVVAWQYYADDFEAPILQFSPTTGYLLVSQRPPELIDIDQDGSLDLVTFTEIGGTNGDFDVFIHHPKQRSYSHAGTMHGNDLARDESGYLVAPSKNGALAYFRFFDVVDQQIEPLFNIDPQGQCTERHRAQFILDSGENQEFADQLHYDPTLIDYYCNIYEKTEADIRRMRLRTAQEIAYVSPDTVFYCPIAAGGGLSLATLTYGNNGYHYAYGPVGEDPDLVLDRPVDATAIEIDRDYPAGTQREEIRLRNGAFTYVVYSERHVFEGDFRRGLTVTRDGTDAPVFDRLCDADTAYDRLLSLYGD